MTCLTLTSAAESVRSRFDEQTVVWTASTSDGIVTAASRRRAASSHSTETAAQTTASLRRCLTSQVRVFSAINPSFTRHRQQLRQTQTTAQTAASLRRCLTSQVRAFSAINPSFTRHRQQLRQLLHSGAVLPHRYVPSAPLTLHSLDRDSSSDSCFTQALSYLPGTCLQRH